MFVSESQVSLEVLILLFAVSHWCACFWHAVGSEEVPGFVCGSHQQKTQKKNTSRVAGWQQLNQARTVLHEFHEALPSKDFDVPISGLQGHRLCLCKARWLASMGKVTGDD